ncbi:MAG: hypothetical protein ACR2FQ_13340 [Pseudonocardiaceae bacterium]
MAEAITDRQVVAALRPFVRGTRPLLDALREADPFGLRERAPSSSDDVDRTLSDRVLDWAAGVHVPGTAAWAAMDVAARADWWVGRVGRFTALVAAVPGIGGALARRLPVQDVLGLAGQGLLVCALAGEHGVRDETEQVRILAAVLFRRQVAASAVGAGVDDAAAAAAAELTEDLTTAQHTHGRATLPAIARTVWRMGRSLWSVGSEIGKRPQGRLWQRALGNVPVVGVLGNYLGERSALRRVADETTAHFS